MRKVRLKYQHVPPTQLYVLDNVSKKSRGVKELAVFIGYVHVSLIVCACVLVFLYSNLLSVIEKWLLHVDMETEPSSYNYE